MSAAATPHRFQAFANRFTSEVIPAPTSLADIRQWAQAFVLAAVREMAKEALAGPEKKAAVLAALDEVVTNLVAVLPMPTWLAFFVKPALTALLKRELRNVAETLIEAILNDQRGNL